MQITYTKDSIILIDDIPSELRGMMCDNPQHYGWVVPHDDFDAVVIQKTVTVEVQGYMAVITLHD